MSGAALAAAWGTALALGRVPALPAPASWDEVLAVIAAERLLPLAWTRGGATMRTVLPPAAIGAWRARALVEIAAAERRCTQALAVVRMLRAGGVDAVLLRGPGLSDRLYGGPALRPGGDVDVLITEREWDGADALLRGAGWVREYGRAPAETAYRRRGERAFAVEVHCTLDDSPLMRHLRLPAAEWRLRQVAGMPVRVHDGPLLPAYLAAHAAKHVLPPLLWFVDLHELWSALDERERADAREVARRCRLGRHLDWGLRRADAVARLAEGDGPAAAELGFVGTTRRDVHNAWRMACLSATPGDAARVVAGWALPADDRRPALATLRRLARRAAKPLGGVMRKEHEYAADAETAPARALALDEPLHQLARDVITGGAALWIRATGDSMRPAIRPGARVRLVAPDPWRAPVRPGAVVLARLPGGTSVLHRVVAIHGERLLLAGDNMATADPPLRLGDVIAVADLVDDAGRVRPVGTRRRGAVRRARRIVGRVVRSIAPTVARGRVRA